MAGLGDFDMQDPFDIEDSSDGESEDRTLQPVIEEPDSDGDIDNDISHAHGPTTSSEKRRAQNEIFKAYAARKAEEITKEEVKEAIKGADDEILSIRDILAKQDQLSQIKNPRDYQTELFQRAKEENIIAVLDTGSGKTHIATLLLRHIIDEELQRRKDGQSRRISFFLVHFEMNTEFQSANNHRSIP